MSSYLNGSFPFECMMAVCVRSVAASRYIRLQVGQGRGSWKASLRFSSPFFSGTGISKKEESMESRFLAAQYSIRLKV